MTKSVTVHATPGTRNQWSTNQKVRVSAKTSDCLVVTSDQNRSTPGLYTRLYLKQNTQYTIEVKGCSYHAKAFVWVFDPKTCKRLIPNYTFLPATRGCVCADFCTPKSANEYVCLYAGALFTGPPSQGEQFELCRVTISCAKGGKKMAPATCPVVKPTAPCHYPPPGVPSCHHYPPQHESSSCKTHADDDHCSTASESEFEVHHHHHQHGVAPDAGHAYGHSHGGHSYGHSHDGAAHAHHHRDPYYTYETHTTAPAYHHGPSTDAYHAHAHPPVHPPHSCPVAPSSSPSYPPAPPDNCRIDDLQTSLESMISRMKKV